MIANYWQIGTIFGILYAITILGVVGTLLSENRNPLKASAWILIIIFVPLLGLLAYILFGQSQRHLSYLSKRFYQRLMRAPLHLSVPKYLTHQIKQLEKQSRLITLLEQSSDSVLLNISKIKVFTHGKDMYADLMEDIAWAKQHIHLQAYIYESDELFDELEELLNYKVSQGVEIRIIYDYIGSYGVAEERWERMRLMGMQIYPFMKVAIPLLSSTVNYRNHRKVSIIDGRIGYVGGMNFAQRYQEASWRDTHFRLEGDAVAALQSAFLLDWYSVSRKVLNMEQYFITLYNPHSRSDAFVQFVLGGPMDKWRSIEQAMIAMLSQARSRISIQTPYFLPTEALNTALITVALSGVQVELMIPEKGDSLAVSYAVASYIDELLSAGIRIYFYQKGFLHSKLIIVDGEISAIGSANMDFRSLEHNFEITGIVYDQALTLQLEALFEQDKDECVALTQDEWDSRNRWRRLSESAMRLFSPMM